jgi:MFS family permease
MAGSLPARTRELIVLCLAAVCWAFSFGVSAEVASVWLQARGYSQTTVGINTSLYYLGIALAAAFVPRLMRRWGAGCAAAGMLASGVTCALFPWGGCVAGWHLLRLLNGFAGAISLIPVETLVNHNAAPEKRARDFGCYAFAIALGMALGNLVGLHMFPSAPRLAFVQGGLLGVAAAVILVGWLSFAPIKQEDHHERTPLDLRRNFLSFGSAWSQGFLEGGMVAHLPIYLTVGLCLTTDQAGWLIGGVMLGVIAFQVPVAWLADRLGRKHVLLLCYGVAALGLLLGPTCSSAWGLTPWLFLVGACSGAFYPLGLAMLGERLPGPSLARANAWYLAINCTGSLIGPFCTGVVMDWFGMRAMFGAGQFAVLIVLAVWAVLQVSSLLQRGRTRQSEADAPLEKRSAA